MAKTTTLKPIALGYRTVGATSGAYTSLMGVLKGLSIAQDEPDSTEIEAEFYDAPFDIFYEGNPVTFTFELANYELSELPNLFGGTYAEHSGSGASFKPEEYEGAAAAYTSEWEWKLDFGRGNASLILYRGLTVGTLKKDADGALNFSVTITALNWHDTTHNSDHMYKIVGLTSYQAVVSPTGSPASKGYYEYSGGTYTLSEDNSVDSSKTYYEKV